MKKTGWVTTLVLLLAAHVAVAADLKGWVLESPDYPNHQGMVQFFDQIKQQTGGRYAGQVFWREDMGVQKKILPQLQSGQLDAAVLSLSPLTDAVPEMDVLQLPFIFRDSQHMMDTLNGDIGKSLQKKLAAKGYIVLAWYNGSSRSFYSRAKPVRYASDFQGKTVRVADRDVMKSMVSALGGTPSTLAYGKVGDALKSGEIDIAENDLISYELSGHYKVAPYYTYSHHTVMPEALVVSTKLWKSLSAADQATFTAAAVNSSAFMNKQRADQEAAARARLEKAGVRFQKLDSASFISRMSDTYKPVLRSPEATDLAMRIMTGVTH